MSLNIVFDSIMLKYSPYLWGQTFEHYDYYTT